MFLRQAKEQFQLRRIFTVRRGMPYCGASDWERCRAVTRYVGGICLVSRELCWVTSLTPSICRHSPWVCMISCWLTTKPGFCFLCFFLCSGVFCCGCMFAFCFVWFSYSIISQKIGLEERLRNDLYYVRWFSLYFYVFRVSLDHFGFVFSNFILLGLVFRYWAKKLAGKNVSEMTYFVSSGM